MSELCRADQDRPGVWRAGGHWQASDDDRETIMRVLLAILLPCTAFFRLRRTGAGVFSLLLQLSVVGWLPAAFWAVYALGRASASHGHAVTMATMPRRIRRWRVHTAGPAVHAQPGRAWRRQRQNAASLLVTLAKSHLPRPGGVLSAALTLLTKPWRCGVLSRLSAIICWVGRLGEFCRRFLTRQAHPGQFWRLFQRLINHAVALGQPQQGASCSSLASVSSSNVRRMAAKPTGASFADPSVPRKSSSPSARTRPPRNAMPMAVATASTGDASAGNQRFQQQFRPSRRLRRCRLRPDAKPARRVVCGVRMVTVCSPGASSPLADRVRQAQAGSCW